MMSQSRVLRPNLIAGSIPREYHMKLVFKYFLRKHVSLINFCPPTDTIKQPPCAAKLTVGTGNLPRISSVKMATSMHGPICYIVSISAS